MTQEMVSNLVYLYFVISSIALMRWGFEILDKFQKKRENGKTKS